MKRNILLIQPPSVSGKIILDYLKYPPMGLAFLASALREKRYEPAIFDASIEKNPFLKLENIIKTGGFNIYGISFSSMTAEGAFKTAEIIKNADKNSIIIAGGYHPTVMTKETLANTNFDFVVHGEGEAALPELLEKIEKKETDFEKLLGIAFRANGEIKINPSRPLIENLDTLPLPAYDLLKLNAYSSPSTTRKPYISYIRSRGCPFSCNFCGVQKMFTRRYRFESPEKTIKNIEELIRKFRVKEILFKDSEFVINKKSVIDFCDLLIQKKYNLIWGVNARADMVDSELLKKMKLAGCNQITYGLESGDQNILNSIGKNITLTQAREAVKITKDIGIKCVANFMLGNTGETADTINKTIKFAAELDPDYVVFNYLIAFPGSDVYDLAIKNNWFINGEPKNFTYESLKLNATKISAEELDKFLKKALVSFYLRPKYIIKRMAKLTPTEIKHNFLGLLAVAKKILSK